MKVISNSSTLIALKNIKRLDLVKKIFKTIIIPDEVYHEVFLHDKQSYPFIEQKSIKSTLAFEILNKTLGRGESACIVLYKEINADLLILDDLRARKIAESHDIKLTGLLGILKIAKEKKIIESYDEIFRQLRKIHFRISQNLIDNFLQE